MAQNELCKAVHVDGLVYTCEKEKGHIDTFHEGHSAAGRAFKAWPNEGAYVEVTNSVAH